MSFDDLISAAEAQRSGLPLTLSLCVSPFPQMIRPDQGRRSTSLFLPVLSLPDLYLSVVLATIHKRVDIKLSSRISIGPRGNLCAAAALLLLFPLSLSLHFKADDGGRAKGGRESDEKSKAVVAVREEGEREGFAAGSDEGDRQRVTFAEKRIISLETERVRFKEGDGVHVQTFSFL